MPRFNFRSRTGPADANSDLAVSAVSRLADRDDRLTSVQGRLLDWYTFARRALPWRDTRDPYAILVSEVMLQQTQVERVVSKYRQFLDRFPTLAALAGAARADVIRVWAPLGYNRRAVRLHELAIQVSTECGGVLPSEPAELARLSGLGPYTSAAVACFAFGHQVATVDTNIRRVLRRVFAERFDPNEPTPRAMANFAAAVLPSGQAADWNQALMDLGATICTARAPSCPRCPLVDLCSTRPRLERADTRAAHLAAEARATYRAEEPFQQSARYFRGRAVAKLRELPPGEEISLIALGEAIRPNFLATDLPWLVELLGGLAADGLARLGGDLADSDQVRVSLP
jgi:A/G-specific adenine glycosylase